MDKDEQRVNDILPMVTSAQIGDSTNEQFIASLGVRNFDICVVAIGDDFKSSLETTALLKEYGAPFVLARTTRDVQAKFLLRNGADDVIYPEKQMAAWAAVRYSADHIFDYIELTEDYSIFETEVPKAVVEKCHNKRLLQIPIQISLRTPHNTSRQFSVLVPLAIPHSTASVWFPCSHRIPSDLPQTLLSPHLPDTAPDAFSTRRNG